MESGRPTACCLVTILLGASGCEGTPSNCEGLKPGDSIHISLIEPLDDRSRFTARAPGTLTCNDQIGLPAGQEFDATLAIFDSNHGCLSGKADQFSIGDWTYVRDPTTGLAQGGEALAGTYLVTHGECHGKTYLSMRSDKLPSSPSIPGQQARSTLEFVYTPDTPSPSAACPSKCFGFMVAVVRKN